MAPKTTAAVGFLLVNLIISLVVPTNSQVPTLPEEDTNSYLGYYWGAAGIASGLMRLAASNIVDAAQNSNLGSIVTEAMDVIWENRYQTENGTKLAAWGKFIDADIYPGLKYGATGIASVFLEAYRDTNNQKYLDWAIQSIDELFLEISNNSLYANWPYAYSGFRNTSGIPITDISFGNLGILDSTLELYQITGYARNLEQALDTYKWLESVAQSYTINDLTVKLLPWYVLDDISGPLYSSFYSGNAAAIQLFIKLGQILDNQTIVKWGHDIANLYLQIQNDDGSWPIIINKPDSLSRTTLELGSAGIIQSLSDLSPEEFPTINSKLISGVNWLVSQINRTNGQLFIPNEPNRPFGKYSVFNGLTGILSAIRGTNITQFDDVLVEGYSYLLQNVIYSQSYEDVIVAGFYPSTRLESYTDLSLKDGLMGIALELLNAIDSNRNLLENNLAENTLQHIVNTYIKFKTTEGIWPKQIAILKVEIDKKEKNSESNWLIWFLLGIPIIAFALVKQFYFEKKQKN